jgi:heme/copper-type cytochrome/quinol oxidase subunit 3
MTVIGGVMRPAGSLRPMLPATRIDQLPEGRDRGTLGMKLAIATEALLFVAMFFGYFYLGQRQSPWPPHPPPWKMAVVMLAVLLVSSMTLHRAEHRLKRGGRLAARLWLLGSIGLGLVFMVLQVLEYREHLQELRPTTNAYGSLFYVITTFHGLHMVAGLLMLIFVAVLPDLEPPLSPARPLHNAALYWHFVDGVWVIIVALLYVLPSLKGPPG